MQRLFNTRVLAIILLSFAVGACDDETTTTPTAPSTSVTETFSGAVAQNGAAMHTFSAAAAGTVKATLKQVGSDNSLVVGFAIGSFVSDACSVVLANDAATGNAVLQGTMTGAGNLCVRVYDVGNVAAGAPVSYTVEVVHP
jgi:hypothetical protein